MAEAAASVISDPVGSNSTENVKAVKKKRPNVFKALMAGSIAGAVAKTTIAPLDRTKIYFQVSSTRGYSFRSAIKFIRLTYKEHGFKALFRGNSATMARVIPYAAVQFAAFEEFKYLLQVDKDKPTPIRRVIVGSLAGVTGTCITYPLDTIKARLSISTHKEYSSMVDAFRKTYADGGLRCFYKGIYPTILGVIPYAGTSFFTFETLSLMYTEETGHPTSHMTRMLFGAFAGLVGQSTSYPLDIVRRRMQTGKLPEPHGRSPWAAMKHIYNTEGLKRGLYKGLSMNWVKGPIATGVSFNTYAFVKELIGL